MSSTRIRASRKPTFADLIRGAGTTIPRLAVAIDVSIATLYRARLGFAPRPVYLRAIAAALEVSAQECREAIERSTKRRRA